MQIQYSPSFSSANEVLLCPVLFEGKHPDVSKYPKSLQNLIKSALKSKQLHEKEGSHFDMQVSLPRMPKSIILVSLGKLDKLNNAKVRSNLAVVIKAARSKQKKDIALMYPEALESYARVIGEVLMMSNHFAARYKTGKNLESEKKKIISKLTIITSQKNQVDAEIRKGMSIGEAVNATRDLINDPPNLQNPQTLADYAKKMAKESGLKCTVLERKDLERLKLGAILAVNRASSRPQDDARLVILEYMPNKNEKPVAIIGKGIIFDTGGYDLKPSKHMADMHSDMSGAAAVIGIMSLVKKLNLKKNIVGLFPLTANLVGPTSYKSSEIITSYSGKTIEITNTDAEGRVVLCDTITYAIKHHKPKQIIDLATLTGACCVALGDRYAGLMGTDWKTIKTLRKLGKETDELVWPLPIHPDYQEKMKSKIADIKNTEDGYYAGAQKGAAFLKFFIEKTPWVHMDIAGTAYTSDPKKYESPMGTGFGVRLLTRYLETL